MKRFVVVLAFAALGGCAIPVDELRARPVAWTAVYPARFDAMANCLAVRTAEDFDRITPQLDQQERRAFVSVHAGAGTLFEYSVRQISERDSEVGYRSAIGSAAEIRKARALADRCARVG